MSRDSGIAAVWVSITLLFILGVAALAVDVGSFYGKSAEERTASDLACLAGVVELPGSSTAQQQAREVAAAYLWQNLELGDTGIPHPTDGTSGFNASQSTWNPPGSDWEFSLEPEWGEGSQMRVAILDAPPTYFARVLGAQTVDVVEEAYCQIFSALPGGIFPVGVPTGFGGGQIKFQGPDCAHQDPDSAPSPPGQCDLVDIPRMDDPAGTDSNSAPTRWFFNVALGSNWPLEPGRHRRCVEAPAGPVTEADPECDALPLGGIAGNKPSALYQGLIRGEANGSSTNLWLGRLEYGDQPAPFSTRSTPAGWPTDTHNNNVWNTNLLHDSSICSGDPLCTGDDDPITSPASFQVSEFDCRDRRYAVVPTGQFVKFGDPGYPAWLPNGGQYFVVEGFQTVYLVAPIPQPNYLGEDPIQGNAVDTISALEVSFTNPVTITHPDECSVTSFIDGVNLPKAPRLISNSP